MACEAVIVADLTVVSAGSIIPSSSYPPDYVRTQPPVFVAWGSIMISRRPDFHHAINHRSSLVGGGQDEFVLETRGFPT